MRILKQLLFLLSVIGLTVLFTGCFNADVDDSEIPWTRPQSWENNAPGLGGGMGQGGSTF